MVLKNIIIVFLLSFEIKTFRGSERVGYLKTRSFYYSYYYRAIEMYFMNGYVSSHWNIEFLQLN